MIIKNSTINLNKANKWCAVFKQLIIVFFFFGITLTQAQERTVNVDSLYYNANNLYKKKDYKKAIKIVNKALVIAPEYIDIRVLRIRLSQRLYDVKTAKNDLIQLISLEKAQEYKRLVLTQLSLIQTQEILHDFVNEIAVFYVDDIDFDLSKAEAYFRLKDIKNTRKLTNKIEKNHLNNGQKYRYRLLLKQTNSNQIGVYYNIASFMKEYPTQKSWHTTQLEYMNFIGKHSFGARVTYSKHFIDNAVLYELESYPVFSDKLYSFINVSTSSKSDFFQKLGVRASVYYTVVKWLEIEGGFRYLSYETNDFISYVIGATSYRNKFYLNVRAFIGPKIKDAFIQNYQANVRYYYGSADDYVSIRLGTGISPDESSRFVQVTSNPNLNSYYATIGATKWLNNNYNISASIGYLTEELTKNRDGKQLLGNIGLKYRF
ncbi:YaiO family outer membrane beta-barrel protein [Tenacibaculum haliotis]|uniref:YaiO family outer membrane beta-barrel protein n=1 Tax=Tenacibaculum haliotis TaxID=1888914 RepID=UPI0021B0878D|nr:YaiO family outer membrane beta-barrel protein [Tenacibaculum haliotis]MCT4699597.1 YaiO family outer membrane beta-barrel protein [Tenacibaculum haliotis]